MARINQIGPGQMTSGTVGGLTYVKGKDGRTYVRSTPTLPSIRQNLYRLAEWFRRRVSRPGQLRKVGVRR